MMQVISYGLHRCGDGVHSYEGRLAPVPVREGCHHAQDGPVAAAVHPPLSICEHTDSVGGRSSSAESGSTLMGGAAVGDEAELRDSQGWCGSGGGCLVDGLRWLSIERLKRAPPPSEAGMGIEPVEAADHPGKRRWRYEAIVRRRCLKAVSILENRIASVFNLL